jgi:hypothetical protein
MTASVIGSDAFVEQGLVLSMYCDVSYFVSGTYCLSTFGIRKSAYYLAGLSGLWGLMPEAV